MAAKRSADDEPLQDPSIPEEGLTVVYEPESPTLDIVFVHGFTGSPSKTWTYTGDDTNEPHAGGADGSESSGRLADVSHLGSYLVRHPKRPKVERPSVFWPADLLPKAVPNARVLTYGYDTHLRHKLFGPPLGRLTLYEFAKDLRGRLEDARSVVLSRPVLFICHSLGGLVVKEMLRQANSSQLGTGSRNILESTVGVMFFGTPHGGADPRRFLHHILEMLIKVAGISANEDVVRLLMPTSEFLQLLKDEFRPIVEERQMKICSFQESKGLKALQGRQVVERSSSYLDIPSCERTRLLGKDHRAMCRFSGMDDPGFAAVITALQWMTSDLPVSPEEEAKPTNGHLTEEQRLALLKSLDFEQMNNRVESITRAHSQTCGWVLKTDEYQDWLDFTKKKDHWGFLWIKGKPGAGKSTLMEFILRHVRKSGHGIISFFFHARGTDLQKNTLGMYRSLLSQLLDLHPHLRYVLDGIAISARTATESYVWGIEMLKTALGDAILSLEGPTTITCLIDALDECGDDEIRDMLDFFEYLGETIVDNQIKFQILFASRYYPHVSISHGLELRMDEREEHGEDIMKYVKSKLKANGKGRDRLLERVEEKASGVFMWVVLVVNILNKAHDKGRPLGHLLKELEKLPSNLHDLFRDILTRDSTDKDELLLCLQWILFARYPLSPQQLYFAIYAGIDPSELEEWDQDLERVERHIVHSSKGLAEIAKSKARSKSKSNEQVVQFIHESVRDFLLKEDGLKALWPGLGDQFVGESHQKLRDGCLTQLGDEETKRFYTEFPVLSGASENDASRRETANKMFPFLSYATENVLHHTNAAQDNGMDQSEFTQRFEASLSDWVPWHNLFERAKIRHYKATVSLLYVLAENNYPAILQGIPEIGRHCLDIEDERYGTPLFAALATKNDQAARIMKDSIVELRRPPLERYGLLQYCENGAKDQSSWSRNFHMTTKGGSELLYYTVLMDDIEVTSLVIAGEVDSYPWGDLMTRLFRLILDTKKLACMKILAEKGVIVKHGYSSAVVREPESATNKGFHNTTIGVEHQGVDIESKRSDGQTLLSLACMYGYQDIVTLLLSKGADIEAQDIHGETPLAKACSSGQQDIITLLLSKGANIETRNYRGFTPLAEACFRGQQGVVTLLLDQGANIEARDNSGRTPLYYANPHIILLLLSKGADIDATDITGSTPLISAVTSIYKTEIIILLLENGANINALNKDSQTALGVATMCALPSNVELLRQRGAKTGSEIVQDENMEIS